MQTIKLKKVRNIKDVFEIVSIDRLPFDHQKRKVFVTLSNPYKIYRMYYGKNWDSSISYKTQNNDRYYIFIYNTIKFSIDCKNLNYKLVFEDETPIENTKVNKLFPLKVGSYYKTINGIKVKIVADCQYDYKELRYVGVYNHELGNGDSKGITLGYNEAGTGPDNAGFNIASEWKDEYKIWIVLYSVTNVHQEQTLASMLCKYETEAKNYEKKFKQKGTFIKTECITIKGD